MTAAPANPSAPTDDEVSMDPYDRTRYQQSGSGGDMGQNLSTLGNGFVTYLRTR